MNRNKSHNLFLSRHHFLLVIIDNLDIKRVLTIPSETNPILIIDPNTVLTFAISLQGLKPISRGLSQIVDGLRKTDRS